MIWTNFENGLTGSNLGQRIKEFNAAAKSGMSFEAISDELKEKIRDVANAALASWGATANMGNWIETVRNFTDGNNAETFIQLGLNGQGSLVKDYNPPEIPQPEIPAPFPTPTPDVPVPDRPKGQVIMTDLLPANSMESLKAQFRPIFEGVMPVALTGDWSNRRFIAYDYVRRVWWAVDEIYVLEYVGSFYRYACYDKLDGKWYPSNKIVLMRGR